MESIKIERDIIDQQALERAVSVLRAGGLVAYPTESLYGIGADCRNPAAIERIMDLKGRAERQVVSVIVSDMQMLEQWAKVDKQARRWIDEFWPGPLTLVLKPKPDVPEVFLSPGLGIRIPGLAWPRELARGLGSAISATSANRSGAANAKDAGEVIQHLGHGLDLVLDAGPIGGGPGSTVVDLCGQRPSIIREGAIIKFRYEHLLLENDNNND